MIHKREAPITLDSIAINTIEDLGRLNGDVIALLHALQIRLMQASLNPPTPVPPSIWDEAPIRKPQTSTPLVLTVSLDKGNDPKNRFDAWKNAQTARAAGHEFGAGETDGVLSFPDRETTRFQWGASRFTVDPEAAPFLRLTLQSIIDIDRAQGIRSRSGDLACTILGAMGGTQR